MCWKNLTIYKMEKNVRALIERRIQSINFTTRSVYIDDVLCKFPEECRCKVKDFMLESVDNVGCIVFSFYKNEMSEDIRIRIKLIGKDYQSFISCTFIDVEYETVSNFLLSMRDIGIRIFIN